MLHGHGPLAVYRHRLATGVIQQDSAQELAAEKLESLHRALLGYRPSSGQTGWKARFGLARRETPPQGLYLFGDVGRGKSMLMDIFFHASPMKAKRRVHFHTFLRDIHAALHVWRKSATPPKSDPLPIIARDIARQIWLLCLDELEIKDIADAMIVGGLFQYLLAEGVVIVTTSNCSPDRLYEHGLQREKFLPFIALVKGRFDVLELSGERDFRLGRMKGLRVYYVPPGPEADAGLAECFHRFANGHAPTEEHLVVHGRILKVPHAAGRIAHFSFMELCESPLGPTDYLQLATHYDVIIIANIPRLLPEQRNAARRFITLIDALYEHRVLLVCSAAVFPKELYPIGDGATEFKRTASRLMEMQAADYIRCPHLT